MTEARTQLRAPRIVLVAGESSGDQLGARLMQSLKTITEGQVSFAGIGGPLMEAEGLKSLFPMSDIAVNGLLPVIRRLPTLLSRISLAASTIARSDPDVVVLIDAQDFNKRVGRKLKRLRPDIPLVGYVSPTVWAWRPKRAAALKPILDHLMAVLPFEPAVHRKLGGPMTTYVGHPLMERVADWRARAEEERTRSEGVPNVLLLPGSRRAEVTRLLPIFDVASRTLASMVPGVRLVMPVVPHLKDLIAKETSGWAVKPDLIEGEDAKWRAFRTARAAIAASGTVTLELALARVPMVVAYRVGYIEGEIARRLITVEHAALPNIILDRRAVPEFIDWGWKGEDLAETVAALLPEGAARAAQMAAFDAVASAMEIEGRPSDHAAGIVLSAANRSG